MTPQPSTSSCIIMQCWFSLVLSSFTHRSSSKDQVRELQRRCDLSPFLHLNGRCRDVSSPGLILFGPGERGLPFFVLMCSTRDLEDLQPGGIFPLSVNSWSGDEM